MAHLFKKVTQRKSIGAAAPCTPDRSRRTQQDAHTWYERFKNALLGPHQGVTNKNMTLPGLEPGTFTVIAASPACVNVIL